MLQRRTESITNIPEPGKVFDYIDENGVPVVKAGRVEWRPVNKPNPHENITRFTLESDNTVVGTLLSGEITPSDVPAGNLTEVVLGNTVTSIRDESFGDGVFQNRGLESVTLPDSITSIGDRAFMDNSLTDVTIPDSVTSIGSYAFYNNSLTAVTIGNSVTGIDSYAFSDNSLTDVTIPDSVTSIGLGAFRNNSLTAVTIGNSVTSIGDGAFVFNSLTDVTIPDSVTSIGMSAFNSNSLTAVTIPDSVTSIEGYAFASNSLTDVTIPDSVTSIGNGVFRNNPNLETVYTETEESAFSGTNIFQDTDLTTVYVRNNDGQLATYPDTSGGPVSWQDASNVTFLEWENWPDPIPN